eukprot:TRINITY_DN1911_c0_g1_i4.p1 TRINITY_DN1911_c0_g1~~TRINITY_DN1911_c0_g1_i4.p1  ORF type:complete len:526 (+),score=175.08 TRINITY_DN1911_c0_g1_i4:298-1875(+)
MQDYSSSMSSLGEVQRIIGLSLSKIQIGRNQRGGLPLHKNLLVATVLNKARDLYMQETMYMNYKMMTGQMACMPVVGQQQQPEPPLTPVPTPTSPQHPQEVVLEPPVEEVPRDLGREEEPVDSNAEGNGLLPSQVMNTGGALPSKGPSRTPDEGFIDECDCDARNFSSESSRVPFAYCYQCAPFHPSNGRGPTLVPSAPGPPRNHHQEQQVEDEQRQQPEDEEEEPTLYDMDSARQLSPRKRRLSDSDGGGLQSKRNRCSSPEGEEEESSNLLLSSSQSNTTTSEVFHPAFRQTQSSTQSSSVDSNGPSMEIEQITSLVSIFSFGQQIMAAAVEANKRLQQKSSQLAQQQQHQSTSCSGVGNPCDTTNESSDESLLGAVLQPKNEQEDDALGGGESRTVESHQQLEGSTTTTDSSSPPKHKDSSSSQVKKEEDSDSESDTSSDSGHSSDDLEATCPEETPTNTPLHDQFRHVIHHNSSPVHHHHSIGIHRVLESSSSSPPGATNNPSKKDPQNIIIPTVVAIAQS